MQRLLPEDVNGYTVRLTSDESSSNGRLLDYLTELPRTLDRFDTLRLDGFAFACTGSSYLLGADAEHDLVEGIVRERRYPVFTAAAAIGVELRRMGARSIAIIAPYPDELVEAARSYWVEAGFEVAALRQVDIGSLDTRSIYELSAGDALSALTALTLEQPELEVDAFLFSGTGMPTLAILEQARTLTGRPVLSSNYCLALTSVRNLGR